MKNIGRSVVRPDTPQPSSFHVAKTAQEEGSEGDQRFAAKEEAGWSSTFFRGNSR